MPFSYCLGLHDFPKAKEKNGLAYNQAGLEAIAGHRP